MSNPALCKGGFQPGKWEHAPGSRRMTCSAVTKRLCLSLSNSRDLPCVKKNNSGKRAGRVYTLSFQRRAALGARWLQTRLRERQERVRRREERVKIYEELTRSSTEAESQGYLPFPLSFTSSGSPSPILSSVGEWAAEGWRILELGAHESWPQGAGHIRGKGNNWLEKQI